MKILRGLGLWFLTPLAAFAAEAPGPAAASGTEPAQWILATGANAPGSSPVAANAALSWAGLAITLAKPCGLALDKDGNFLITDIDRMAVFKMTPQGVLTVVAGVPGKAGSMDGPGAGATFYFPTDLLVDRDGTILVADSDNSSLRKISPAGLVTTLISGLPTVIPSGGTVTLQPAPMRFPAGLARDAAGNFIVADPENNLIATVSLGGVFRILAGKPGADGSVDGKSAEVRFGLPRAVAMDGAGTVYVADEEFNTIRKIAPDGSVTTLAGNPNAPEGAPGRDGVGVAAVFVSPRALTLDAKGNVYVADTNGHSIRKITPEGVVTTVAGKTGMSGNADGKGDAARFREPRGIVVDKAGNIFVADTGNGCIRKITPDGVVTTVGK